MTSSERAETPGLERSRPRFDEPLHVGSPNVVNREGFLSRLEGLLDRNRLTNFGPLVGEFEERLADLCGVRHAVAVCNATVGLEVATRALDLTGEVIVPSWTFVATAHALQWQEIRPIFADVDPVSHTLDPTSVESLVTPLTTGILGVHLFGRPCDVAGLRTVADRHGLRLLFDAAHALGVTHRGRPVGSLGECEVLSFHATKFLNTFEGGAIVTDDAALARRVRLMCNFGFEGRDRVSYLGTNAKMSEVSAAMGLAQLDGIDELIATNRRNYHAYRRLLAEIPGIHLRTYDGDEQWNYQYIVCEVDPTVAGVTRDELVEWLEANNVLARRYFSPGCHRMEPYASYQPHAGLLLPTTERISERVVTLPTGTSIGLAEVEGITEVIAECVFEASDRGRGF